MHEEVNELLKGERVCVLTVMLPDGSPHSATVHFSYAEEPLKFYIQTTRETVKVQPVLKGETVKGSIVVGFSEEEWLTFQLRGDVRAILDEEELEKVYNIHYRKHPEAERYKSSKTVFLKFTPTWWRYTDFNTDPETVITSDEE